MQARLDPAAVVVHNESLIDRWGHSRQFDVAIRGVFAGQQMLGIIECKDLSRKVGLPEVDAFITKSQDVNANFKILMSRRGFSKHALEKCKKHGIQAFSMLNKDPANNGFFVGARFTADLLQWTQLSVKLHYEPTTTETAPLDVNDLKIDGKRIIDWFTNYLLDIEETITSVGWVVDKHIQFATPRDVSLREGDNQLCTAITFKAERLCEQYEKLVGINGDGFFDWNANHMTFPPQSIRTDLVPMDLKQWSPRIAGAKKSNPTGFPELHIIMEAIPFPRVPDAVDLEQL